MKIQLGILITVLCAAGVAAAQASTPPAPAAYEAAAMRQTLALMKAKIDELKAAKPPEATVKVLVPCENKITECTVTAQIACVQAAVVACQPVAAKAPAMRPIIKQVEQAVTDAKGCFTLTGPEATNCWKSFNERVKNDGKAMKAWTDAAVGPAAAKNIPESFGKRAVRLHIHHENVHTGTSDTILEVEPEEEPRTYASTAFNQLVTTDAAGWSSGETVAIWAGIPAAGTLVGLGLAALISPAESGTEDGNAVFEDGAEWKGALVGLAGGLAISTVVYVAGGDEAPKPVASASRGGSGLATVFSW